MSVTLAVAAAPIGAQGKGKGQSKGHSKGQDRGHAQQSRDKGVARATRPGPAQQPDKARGVGKSRAAGNASRRGAGAKEFEGGAAGDVDRRFFPTKDLKKSRTPFRRVLFVDDVRPKARPYVVSKRAPERVVGSALAYALARGVPENALLLVPTGDRVLLRNRTGRVLVDLDENRATNLGAWDVVPIGDRIKEGSPAFCRSGAGHPVWGRQWCIDKGFGLGSSNPYRWGRTVDLDEIVFREVTTPTLVGAVLRNAIGDVAFDRLAVHALTLGLVDQLTGRWMGESTGPRVLLVTSGSQPVAELVDTDRDNRADGLIVALRPWQ